MSALGAQKVHRHTTSMQSFGSWRSDLILEGGSVPTGAVTLTIGSGAGALTLKGAVRDEESGFDAPDRPRVVVVGAPGWERPVAAPPSYQSDGGVRLRNVLADLAARAGETIEQPPDVTIGTSFAAPASRDGSPLRLRDVLAALRTAGYVAPWRADPDGVTRFGARAGVPVTARATVLRRNRAAGMTVVGIDAPASFLPGNVVDGARILRTVFVETPGALTAELYRARPSIMTSILRKVYETFPQLAFGFPRTYRVHALHTTASVFDGRLDLSPPPDAPYLPELAAVPQWTMGGALVAPAVGSEVVVVFRDANPTRPLVVGMASLVDSTPTALTLDTSGPLTAGGSATLTRLGSGTENLAIGAEVTSRRVVCYGDNIAGLVVSGGAAAGTIIQNPLTAPNPIAKVRT